MTELTYSQAYRDGVREEMARDSRIFVMGTDLFIRGGHWAQVKGLGQEFGVDRVRDVPISEAAMVAAGVGAAAAGMRPIVDLNFLDFIFGAMDEVANQAAKIRYMWNAVRAPRHPRHHRRGVRGGPAQQPARVLVRQPAGAAGGDAGHPRRLQGHDQVRAAW